MKTAKGGESLDIEMSAKELAGYKWEGMRNSEGRAFFEGSESIKVTVGNGSDQKTWYLPKKVLTHCSPFFNAALNGGFVEGNSEALSLPEDDPVAFEMWATWLSIGGREDFKDHLSDEEDYVRAWKLGDKLACPAFKDYVMLQLMGCLEESENPWIDKLALAYDGSSPGSKLRRFFVDLFVFEKMQGRLAADADEFITFLKETPEFLEDSAKEEMKADKNSIQNPWDKQHRYYENPALGLGLVA